MNPWSLGARAATLDHELPAPDLGKWRLPLDGQALGSLWAFHFLFPSWLTPVWTVSATKSALHLTCLPTLILV